MRARRYYETRHGSVKKYRSADGKLYKSYFQCEPLKDGDDAVPWFAIDRADCGYRQCDVYNVDGIAYESILLHGLALLHSPANGGELKNNTAHLGFSRDGFHVTRPDDRRPFVDLHVRRADLPSMNRGDVAIPWRRVAAPPRGRDVDLSAESTPRPRRG